MADSDQRRRLESVRREIARVDGRRAAMVTRSAALERDVSLAMGRLAIRKDVEAFISQLQHESARRKVASVEAMLGSLVDETLPDLKGGKPLKLELSTERGLSSLDVVLAVDKDRTEDVLEDNGGALTNVISMGLRLIAAVKSGSRPFLALDEPDCWIKPDRVPSVYRVLKSAAARLKVQCVVISHHDVSAFEDGVHVVRVTGFPDKGGTKFVNEGPPPVWAEEQDGFRWIRYNNVQGYADARVDLAPGVTAIIGPNNRGKSTTIRGLRARFYGEARDSLVRHDARQALIEIGVKGGRFLRFTRPPRRNPVNQWSYHEADGSVVEENGVRYESAGKIFPEWVEKLFGIHRIDGLDVHLSNQKSPVFLLGETASKRASILSVGQESGYIQDMLAIHKECCLRDQALVRDGEQELAALREDLTRLEALPEITAMADSADVLLTEIIERREAIATMKGIALSISNARAAVDAFDRRAEILSLLPDDDDVRAVEGRLRKSEAISGLLGRIEAASAGLAACARRAEIYADLPDSPPAIKSTDRLISHGVGISTARKGIAAAAAPEEAYAMLPHGMPTIKSTDRLITLGEAISLARSNAAACAKKAEEIDRHIASVVDEIESILAAGGGACPACGQAVDDPSMLLEGHAHS